MPLSDDTSGFRLHREPSSPAPADDVEEKKGITWPEVAVFAIVFGTICFIFWLFLK